MYDIIVTIFAIIAVLYLLCAVVAAVASFFDPNKKWKGRAFSRIKLIKTMDDRKQYARKVVINIIHFMAQAGAGIKLSKEEMDQIPEELHQDIMAALIAAREVKKVQALALMAKAFPIGEILEEAMKEAEEKSKED